MWTMDTAIATIFATLFLMLVDRYLLYRRNVAKAKAEKNNKGDNPHPTNESMHIAITDRTAEMKSDIKDLQKDVKRMDKSVGILLDRDPGMRSRKGEK